MRRMIRTAAAVATILCSGIAAHGHEGFLPLHTHQLHRHDHGHDHSHEHDDDHSKHGAHIEHPETRFSFATGVRYTEYDLDSGDGNLWESGAGFSFAATPWLYLGGEFSYGWFSSKEGDAEGWLRPSAHIDFHAPLGGNWELIAGLEVGFPAGDDDLTGDEWEWMPHLEIRYDAGPWFVEVGASYLIVSGSDHDHGHAHEDHAEADEGAHEHEHEEEHGHEEGHAEEEEHTEDLHAHEHSAAAHASTHGFHEIVDPHGEQEWRTHIAAGVRLLDERLTLRARVSAVHVAKGETENDNYFRVGANGFWRFHERLAAGVDINAPIGGPRRNEWQASASLRVEF